jgi:murein L,D-transpeptidase YafK
MTTFAKRCLAFFCATTAVAAAARITHQRLVAVPTSPRLESTRAKVAPGLRQELAQAGMSWGSPIFLRVFKETSELEVWVQSPAQSPWRLFHTWPIATYGGRGLGPKQKQGDGMAPEGVYAISSRQLNPNSNYHLALNVGYPNELDRALGRTGDFIMIHGGSLSIGCYAMTDPGIEKIYLLADEALRHGQSRIPLHIFPFRFTEARLQQAQTDPAYATWQDLRLVFSAFEAKHTLPTVKVKAGRYHVVP